MLKGLEKGDPFLTSLTSVSTRMIKKQDSDEHLAVNLNTSDSDVSPRQLSKQKKGKSRRKGSVEPSGASDADTDLDGSLNRPSKYNFNSEVSCLENRSIK